jgi:protein involved in polysaccharide export with SLBB domain
MKRKSPVALLLVVLLTSFSAAFAQSDLPATSQAELPQQAIASVDLSKNRDVAVSVEGQKQYDAGVRLYEAAKFSEALAAFKEVAKVRPNDAQAYFMMGMSEARLQNYKNAIESFKRAVRVKPDWAEAQFRLGVVAHVWGRSVLAGEAYTSLLKLNSPLASTLFRVMRDDKNRASVAAQFWKLEPDRSEAVAKETTSPMVKTAAPAPSAPTSSAPTTTTTEPLVTEAYLANVYRIGVGDILDIRILNSITPRSTLFTVLEGGLIDYPVAGGPMLVAGLTTDEVQATVAAELKRRAVEEGARVSVGVRHYASHSVSVTGLVSNPGTRMLRREAVPLYVVMAESQLRQDAGRVVVMRSGTEVVLDLAEPTSLNFLIKPGDLISVFGRPQLFYYIGGKVNYPGQKVFQSGLTLLQAILAAGGAARPGNNVVEISRDNGEGRLSTTKFSLKEIKAGKVLDPQLQPGDRIDIVR